MFFDQVPQLQVEVCTYLLQLTDEVDLELLVLMSPLFSALVKLGLLIMCKTQLSLSLEQLILQLIALVLDALHVLL